jgi:ABC-type tungstate transport system substrate-binding protein
MGRRWEEDGVVLILGGDIYSARFVATTAINATAPQQREFSLLAALCVNLFCISILYLL